MIGIILGMLILFSSFVIAFAVSMPSLPEDNEGNRVLYIMPGEEESMTFVVQNGGGATSEVIVKAEIIEGSEIIEIEMSPAQFAEAITSLNIGCGVPCTIKNFNRCKSVLIAQKICLFHWFWNTEH